MSATADHFKTMGNNCMKNQDFKAAIENYKKGLAIDPKNPILNCNIAQAYLNIKEFTEAEKCAKAAIENQENYVKAYYRAAKGALGRHNVYDCMLYLAEGVQKCANMDLEDLFGMAKELSPEFENALRTFRDKEKGQKKDTASSSSSEPSNQIPVAGERPQSKNDKKASSSKAPNEVAKKTNSDNSDIKLREDKVKQNRIKQKEIEEQEKLLESKKKQLKEESEREIKELEDLKKQEKAAQELKERKRKEQERIKEEKEKERKEQEQKEKERKEQEQKEKERKEQEQKEKERKEHEQKEKERKEQEQKERERKEQERKERERKERERQELERKVWEKKELEKKALQLKLQQQEEEKKRVEEGLKLKLKEKEKHVSRQRSDVYYQMRDGSLALCKGLNRKAADSFNKALQQIHSHPSPETWEFDDPMDLVVLQFAFSQALILSDEYNDIVKAIHLLETLEKEGKHSKFPAVFHSLGRAYMRLNRFKNALLPLERGICFLKRGTPFSRYSWPGTDDVIDLTDRSFLTDSLEEELQICKLYHKPDAVCFYDNCLDISQHIVPSNNIFFTDPDFIGFVNVICQEHCQIYFHLSCWKDYKENLSEVEKLSEKDFLGRACLTPDCRRLDTVDECSIIVKVSIIGPDGEEKSSCEFTPPPISSLMLRKESETVDKSPKKKQRKKETDRNDRNNSRRKRQDSKSQGEGPLNAAPEKNLNGRQYSDALNKLAAAREHNFGYDSEAPDPNKVSLAPLSNMGKDEEFVYSYFLEIFKSEGYMSIFKLQEHWESNKELLPVLDPALITHTDLIKFLLDTGGFAVVQDLIGISSELPNISAIVEAKVEVPQPAVYEWTPSPATVLEASKTLSFASVSNDSETVSEETESKRGDKSVFLFEPADHHSTSGESSSTDCSSYQSAVADSQDELDSQKLPETDELLVQNVNVCSSGNPAENDPLYNTHLSKMEEINSSVTQADNVECHVAKNESNNNILNANAKVFKMSPVKVDGDLPSENVLAAKALNFELTSGKKEDCFNNNQSLSVVTKEPIEASGVLTANGRNGHTNQDKNTTDGKPPVVTSAQKSTWQPRAKLLEWACETFPGESKAKLWEALTFVRAQNNNTLSWLSFDVIADRVRDALQMQSSEYADI